MSLLLDLVTPVVVVGYWLGLYVACILCHLSLMATCRISLTVLFTGLRIAQRLGSWLLRHDLLLTFLVLVHAVLADLLSEASRVQIRRAKIATIKLILMMRHFHAVPSRRLEKVLMEGSISCISLSIRNHLLMRMRFLLRVCYI